jgi:hypothetical protein
MAMRFMDIGEKVDVIIGMEKQPKIEFDDDFEDDQYEIELFKSEEDPLDLIVNACSVK